MTEPTPEGGDITSCIVVNGQCTRLSHVHQAENDVPAGFVDGDPLLDEILVDLTENDHTCPRCGGTDWTATCTRGHAACARCRYCPIANAEQSSPPGVTSGG